MSQQYRGEGLLSSAEAAAVIGCSTRTLARLVAAHRIAHVRWGAGQLRPRIGFTRGQVEEFVLSCQVLAELSPSTHAPEGARVMRRVARRNDTSDAQG